MKKFLSIISGVAILVGGIFAYSVLHAPEVSAACGNGYGFCNTISFNTSMYGSSDTSNFAALFSTSTMSSLATVGNGGDVQNTVNQSGGSYTSTVPADLVFTTDAGCTTNVAGWEFESYNSATGAVNVWINIGTLSHSNTSVIYMCYGNASVTTQQMTTTATWDSNYKAVFHLAETTVTNGSMLHDSTSNADNVTLHATGYTASAGGKVDGALNLGTTGSSDYGSLANAISLSSGLTASFWLENPPSIGNGILWSSGNAYYYFVPSYGNIGGYFGGASTGIPYTSPPSNTWAKFDVVVDSSGNLTMYENGVSIGTTTVSTSLPIDNLFAYSSFGYGFGGLIDEMEFSATNRSADQVLAEYNNQNSPLTFYTVGATQTGGGGGGGTNYPTPVQAIIKGQVIVKSQTIIN